MIVLAALDDHVMILHSDHARLALMGSRPGAGPVSLRTGCLIAGEGEFSNLKFATSAKSCYVGVVGHRIYENRERERKEIIS